MNRARKFLRFTDTSNLVERVKVYLKTPEKPKDFEYTYTSRLEIKEFLTYIEDQSIPKDDRWKQNRVFIGKSELVHITNSKYVNVRIEKDECGSLKRVKEEKLPKPKKNISMIILGPQEEKQSSNIVNTNENIDINPYTNKLSLLRSSIKYLQKQINHRSTSTLVSSYDTLTYDQLILSRKQLSRMINREQRLVKCMLLYDKLNNL